MAFKFETANERWSWFRGTEPREGIDYQSGATQEQWDENGQDSRSINQKNLDAMLWSFENGWTPEEVGKQFAMARFGPPVPTSEEIQEVYNKWQAQQSTLGYQQF